MQQKIEMLRYMDVLFIIIMKHLLHVNLTKIKTMKMLGVGCDYDWAEEI